MTMNSPDKLDTDVRLAVEAAQGKQALDICVLNLRGSAAFADYFVLCSASSAPQMKAISDAVEERLHQNGRQVAHREGRAGAEWMLLDYGFLIVHIFSERARMYYDLERLWRNAERIEVNANEGDDVRHGGSPRSTSQSGSHPEPEGNAAR
jgi:ribosome-associated protein